MQNIRDIETTTATQSLIFVLSKECRDEVYWIANIKCDGVHDLVPDPTLLDQKRRRLLVRSIFAFIEAVSFALKSEAIRGSGKNVPTPEELSIAREESFDLDDRGHIKKTKAKLRTIPNLRFAFHLYSRISGFEYELDSSCTEWQRLVESLKVRDRLMHPKSLNDLTITNDEIASALSAYLWFEAEVISLLEEHGETLRGELNQLLKKHGQLKADTTNG
jgi:hypothetical protein